MLFRVPGLDPSRFRPLSALLGGARRCVVDAQSGFPDRIEVRDREISEIALLPNVGHPPASTPFRARHAIFAPLDLCDGLPEAIRVRTIPLRASDRDGGMPAAGPADGRVPMIGRFLPSPRVAYCCAHHAAWGCHAARIERS